MIAVILFWIFLVLYFVGVFIPPTYTYGGRAPVVFLALDIMILGLKLFGNPFEK